MGGSGGYLWFDKDSECSDSQKSALQWKPQSGMRQHSLPTSRRMRPYITVSCKDTKSLCGKMIDGKAVGSYAWTYNGWFANYHYITLCPPLDTLDTKIGEVEKDLASDGGVELHIIDEYVVPIPDGEKPVTQCWLMLSDTTGYFPGVPGKNNPSTAQDDFDDDDFPVSLYVDLVNSTNPSTTDITSLFNTTDLVAFGDGPPDPDDQVTTTAAAPPPATSTAAPPPVTSTAAPPPAGTCCFHVDEWQDCNDDSKNLYANITLYDNSKKTPENYLANGGLGEPINAGNAATFQGPLSQPVQITGEHDHDYIQFTYGSLSWTSRTTSGPANCHNGGWNPCDGPFCVLGENLPAENQVDCCFPC
ncbi:hypothetical protein V8E54_000766 [Elaphomyces granulatus]